jgi:hypothetical protein
VSLKNAKEKGAGVMRAWAVVIFVLFGFAGGGETARAQNLVADPTFLCPSGCTGGSNAWNFFGGATRSPSPLPSGGNVAEVPPVPSFSGTGQGVAPVGGSVAGSYELSFYVKSSKPNGELDYQIYSSGDGTFKGSSLYQGVYNRVLNIPDAGYELITLDFDVSHPTVPGANAISISFFFGPGRPL